MSLTTVPIKKVAAIQPALSFSDEYTYFIQKGGAISTMQPYNSSNYDNSQITFTVTPPSNETVIDRYAAVELKFRVAVTGSAPGGGGNLLELNSGIWGIRSFPLNSVTQTATLNLNGTSTSTRPKEYISALQWLVRYQMESGMYQTTFPSLPDNSQKYTDTYQHNTNVLNPVGNGEFYQESRGSFFVTVLPGSTGNLTTSAYIDFVVNEPVLLPPFSMSPGYKERGLTNVDKFDVTLSLANLERIFCYNATDGNALTSVSASIISNPVLHLRQYTRPITMSIPDTILYGTERILSYQTSAGSQASQLGTSSTFSVNSNQIQLSLIPNEIIVFARRSDASLGTNGYQYSDCFAELVSVSVNFNNAAGLLSSASEADLWRISVENGLKMPFGQWRGSGQYSATDGNSSFIGVGSILVIRPYKDLGLPPDLASGVVGQSQNFSLTANFRNISSDTVDYTLFIVTVTDSILSINKSQAIEMAGVVTREEVLNAPEADMDPTVMSGMYGGSVFGDIKKFFNKHKDIISKGLDIYSNIGQKVADTIGVPEAKPFIDMQRKAVKGVTGFGMIPKSQKARLKSYMS